MPDASVVTLAVVAPSFHGDFDPSIEGVKPITREGPAIPTEHEKAIRAAARREGVTLKVTR